MIAVSLVHIAIIANFAAAHAANLYHHQNAVANTLSLQEKVDISWTSIDEKCVDSEKNTNVPKCFTKLDWLPSSVFTKLEISWTMPKCYGYLEEESDPQIELRNNLDEMTAKLAAPERKDCRLLDQSIATMLHIRVESDYYLIGGNAMSAEPTPMNGENCVIKVADLRSTLHELAQLQLLGERIANATSRWQPGFQFPFSWNESECKWEQREETKPPLEEKIGYPKVYFKQIDPPSLIDFVIGYSH